MTETHVWFISLRRPDGTIQPGYWTASHYSLRDAQEEHDPAIGELLIEDCVIDSAAIMERINRSIPRTDWLGWTLERNLSLDNDARDELLAILTDDGWW